MNLMNQRIPAGIAFVIAFLTVSVATPQADGGGETDTLRTLMAGWNSPARTYKPHTRWWWPGNALTRADITFQLEQMAAQGIGGVEIMSVWKMYEKGNVEYLTSEFLALVKHAVAEGKRLNIEVAITFGPGWSFGGSWVPREDQSKALCMADQEVAGGKRFNGKLPEVVAGSRGKKATHRVADGAGRLVAVVAGRITGKNQLDAASLTVLTSRVQAGTMDLEWDVPAGQWRLMAFWLNFTGQENQAQSFKPSAKVIDHLNKGAVRRYCDYLGGAFAKELGGDFGTTVDSFFCDSFEIASPPDGLLWSDDTLGGFQKHSGYDFTKYLPALWCDIGDPTPRVRYDLGKYLSDLGLEAFFKTFNDWCDAHKVQARIQPHYRFTEELVQGAGATARPETEVTTTRFEPVVDPRKATASGARFYGSDIVSAEAYTFIHPARYRTDMADIKIATDAFLRDGITQFYNHGYLGSPEMHVAPSRDIPWANRISHWNTWWPYYHHLTEYVARCCYLLRQGRPVSDVLIYSPQATAWSKRALWGESRRVLPYGNLGKTLVANGYDFDVVNDDLLQHHARFANGGASINGYPYRVMILPCATVVPIESMRAIRDFVKAGGTVIALEELPAAAAGLNNHEANDRELRQIVGELFGGSSPASSGSVFLPKYRLSRAVFSPTRQPYSKTPPLSEPQRELLAAVNRVTPPDFMLANRAQSDGLTFLHKRVDGVDVYFVCNLQPTRIETDVMFRVTGKTPQRWDAISGETGAPVEFRAAPEGTVIPLAFEPWESAFYLFTEGSAPVKPAAAFAGTMPEALAITGNWNMKLEGHDFDTLVTNVSALSSWTDSERSRHFSGNGRYETEFVMPAAKLVPGTRMMLELGQVGNLAEVELNGQVLGVTWMAPYRLDITRAVRAGANKLVVRVTNTLINRVSGMKTPPEVPAELQARLGKVKPSIYPAGRKVPEMSETDLPPSGLIGPVRIVWHPAR